MTLRAALALVLCGLIAGTRAYTASTCPSTIPESSRKDCMPGVYSDESSCNAKGCMWCESSYQGPPWCFYNDDNPVAGGDCTDCSSCSTKIDCYPEPGSSESGCYDRGCLWCPSNVNGEPWCIVKSDDSGSSSTTAAPEGPTFGPTDPSMSTTPSSGDDDGSCTSCSTCSPKVDCYPEAGSSESGCYSRGCLWCPSSVNGEPWCIVPDGVVVPTQAPSQGCTSEIPEQERIDCWPGGGATEAGCIDAGCYWCESSMNGVPWCFLNTTNLPEGIPDEQRVNCIPEGGFSPNTCSDRDCIFASTNSPDAPLCYFDNSQYGYLMVDEPVPTSNGYKVTLQRLHTGTLFGNDVDTLTLDVTFDSASRLHMKFYDASNDRFEVPLDIKQLEPSNDMLYDVEFYNDPSFYFKVIRKSTGTVLFDTSLGGLTFSDQFLQISTKLPSDTLYGFGEHEHQTLAHSFDWETYGMYARDQPPDPGANLYGVHPFYLVIEDDGNSHGVLFLNSNAQDVTLTPAPGLVYKTIGGVLDMYMFLGPEPKQVVEQYTSSIGPQFLPPYWSLGFQLCRYGYGSLDVVKATVERMDAYQIPLDVQYGDIDYMNEQRDFTYDTVNYAGLPQYVDQLHAGGKHYIIILDPCVTMDDPPGTYPPYDEGAAMNVFVTTSDGITPLPGKVWPPGRSAFPDYTNPDTEVWWTNQCKSFHDVIKFDGLWIDMNEPANFVSGSSEGCEDNTLNYPPYVPQIWGGVLQDKSVCPDARHKLGNHYDVHNLFGWSQSNQTYYSAIASTGKRHFIVSRSTFPGSGQWAAHWLGDNNSDWHDLRKSIIGMIEFNLFGIPYVGADICGFNGDVNEELCQRWMELGSFYPFSRNHNGLGYKEQDPAAWGPGFADRTKKVLETRYTLLPYLYTMFYHAHVSGSGVVRPLSFEFVGDKTTHTIDEQFMWGSGLLFSPVLYQSETSVTAYFPDARWFDYYSGAEQTARGTTATLSAPLGTIPIHIRGGVIIPTQDPAVNTVISRKNPFGLLVALDDNSEASGDLYWDSGDDLDPLGNGDYAYMTFAAKNGQVSMDMSGDVSQVNGMVMGSVRVFGVNSSPSKVYINGSSVSFSYSNKELSVSGLSADITKFSMNWS